MHFDQVNFDEMHLYVYFLVHPNDFHFKVQFEVHIVMQIEVTFEVHFQVHFDEVWSMVPNKVHIEMYCTMHLPDIQ